MARDIIYTDYQEIQGFITPEQREYVAKKAEDYKNDLFPVGFHMLHSDNPPTIRMTVFVNPNGTAVDVELPLDAFMKLRRFRKEEETKAKAEKPAKPAKAHTDAIAKADANEGKPHGNFGGISSDIGPDD